MRRHWIIFMPGFTIENHLPHRTNIVPRSFFDLAEKSWEGREYIPRSAEATVAFLGLLRVRGYEIPVLQRRFTNLIQDEYIQHDPTTLKIVSQETIAAAHRSGRPIDDLVYPLDIIRNPDGSIGGARAFGMPVPTPPIRRPELALSTADVARLGDLEETINTANFPVRFYNPDAALHGTDLIDMELHEPLVELPLPSAPLDSSPHLELDVRRTEQFGAPIMQVRPNYGSDGIKNLPEQRDTLHFIHPIALRHMALRGMPLDFCVVSGGLLRDFRHKTVAGATAVYVFDPDMLATDGI
jgi:hypothetical protein